MIQYAWTASRTSQNVRTDFRFPTRMTGLASPNSAAATCFAKKDMAKTSPRLGPVWVNIRVRMVFIPCETQYWNATISSPTFPTAYGEAGRKGHDSRIGMSASVTCP